MARRTLGYILFAALVSAPVSARAQAGSGSASAPSGGLAAERQRLRADLERVNAEIDALKRDHRSLRTDYRLRGLMADAESLARRLTEIDTRLRGPGAASVSGRDTVAPGWSAAPEAKASDDSAVLEAKADILADQAHRLDRQANILSARVNDLRSRNQLRRRAGQLESDPFSPLEQAKRRLATTGSLASTGSVGTSGAKSGTFDSAPQAGNQAPMTTPGTSRGNDSTANPVLSPGGSGPTTAGAGPPPASIAAPGASLPSGPVSSPGPTTPAVVVGSTSAGSVNKAQPSLLPLSPSSSDAPGSVALQFSGVLDAATIAEIRRLEETGSPTASISAMEWALSALRARAAELSANAKALRNRAGNAR